MAFLAAYQATCAKNKARNKMGIDLRDHHAALDVTRTCRRLA